MLGLCYFGLEHFNFSVSGFHSLPIGDACSGHPFCSGGVSVSCWEIPQELQGTTQKSQEKYLCLLACSRQCLGAACPGMGGACPGALCSEDFAVREGSELLLLWGIHP